MSEASRDQIRSYLKEWANSATSPKFAVMLEGEWGSGKTHFVQSLLNDTSFTGKKTIYLSLFGVATLKDFEQQLFYAGASKLRRFTHQGVGFLGAIASGGISIGSGGLLGGTVDLSKTIDKLSVKIADATTSISQSLVVIDDLERHSFPLSDLIGLLNVHIEHGDARVILIANSEKINDQKFTQFKEKVVGQNFRIPPDFDSAVTDFVGKVTDPAPRSIVSDRKQKIGELYQKSGYNNLRALRHYIWHISKLLSGIDGDLVKSAPLMDAFLQESFIFFIEFKLNLGAPEIQLSPKDIVSTTPHSEPDNRSFYAFRPSKDGEDPPKLRVLKKYGRENGFRSCLHLKSWKEILEAGTIDKAAINEELRSAPTLQGPDQWPAWKRLWHFWEWDFRDGPDPDFDRDIQAMLEGLKDDSYTNPLVFMHVAGVILMLARKDLLPEGPAAYVPILKDYMSNTMMKTFDLAKHKAALWSFDSGYDGLGYSERESDEFSEILTHLQNEARAWYDRWLSSEASTFLLGLLANDKYGFFGELTVSRGRGDQRFLREPVLHKISVDEFVATWTKLPRMDEELLIRSIWERYEFQNSLIEAEGPWWIEVWESLDRLIKGEDYKPRKAQLKSILSSVSNLLNSFYYPSKMKELLINMTCDVVTDIEWSLRRHG